MSTLNEFEVGFLRRIAGEINVVGRVIDGDKAGNLLMMLADEVYNFVEKRTKSGLSYAEGGEICASVNTTEQPDPTAETLQEADALDANGGSGQADMYMGLRQSDVMDRAEKDGCDLLTAAVALKADALDAGEDVLSDEAGPSDFARALDADGVAPVIGSYSDVSDDDVRAAGGTVSNSLSASYDFGPKA